MVRIDDRIIAFDRRNQRSVPSWLAAIALLLIVARFGTSCAEQTRAGDDLVKWVPLDQAARVAAESGKPIMFDFTAEWCGPCHRLDAAVFRDEKLAATINDRFIPVRVVDRKREDGSNKPEVEELQQRYGVGGFPTVLFVDSNGAAQGRIEGFRGREHFERTLSELR